MSVTPTYTLEVPSTKQKVKYRPFLVKDEKALLIAQQSDDLEIMVDTLKDLVKSCVKDPIDVEKLAAFDLEYIFLQLRSVSVGEIADIILLCDECDKDNAKVKLSLNLSEIKVQVPEGHTNNIKLFDDVGVIMKYPSLDVIKKLETINTTDMDEVFDVVVSCIESIYDSNEVYLAKDHSREDVMEFLNNLTSDQFEKIQHFFTTMPRLKQEVDYACPECGTKHHKVLEGLSSFF